MSATRRPDVLLVSDAAGGNYEARVRDLARALDLGPGYFEVDVLHDESCPIFGGEPCSCDPDVRLRAEA